MDLSDTSFYSILYYCWSCVGIVKHMLNMVPQYFDLHTEVLYLEYRECIINWNYLFFLLDNFEKEHVSLGELENVTFTNALDPVSQDREVSCRSLFHNKKTDQNVYSISNMVLLNKTVEKTVEKTEKRTGYVTVTANTSSNFFNIGDDVYYTCESSNFTVSPKLSAFQRNTKGNFGYFYIPYFI